MKRRRRSRASVRCLKNRHLAAYALLQQAALLADAVLLEGSPTSVRAALSCLREATAVLEELLRKGSARATRDSTVPDLTRRRRRLAVLEALGGRAPEFPPPRRAA